MQLAEKSEASKNWLCFYSEFEWLEQEIEVFLEQQTDKKQFVQDDKGNKRKQLDNSELENDVGVIVGASAWESIARGDEVTGIDVQILWEIIEAVWDFGYFDGE